MVLSGEIKSWFRVFADFSFSNLVEIILIALILYKLLVYLRNSHAVSVIKGIAVIMLFSVTAFVLRLTNILWIVEKISGIAVIGLLIVFQPELRKGLESLGKQKFVAGLGSHYDPDAARMTDETVEELIKSVFAMAKVKTGALIVIRENDDLKEYEDTGIMIDGIVSSALLINAFEKNTPLHDGALIITGNRVRSATCYLPLSDNEEIPKELGTRHRAAIGASEVTDAFIIVVSEETGHVSTARNGMLSRVTGQDELRTQLKGLESYKKNKNQKKLREGRKNGKA